MRRAFFAILASAMLAGVVPSSSFAQSAILDLSKPQIGKSEFVLNSDFTAADLGVTRKGDEAKEKASSSAVSDWCASGCRMLAPQTASSAQADQRSAFAPQTRGGSSVVVVNAYTRKDGTEVATHTRRSSGFRFGRRRR